MSFTPLSFNGTEHGDFSNIGSYITDGTFTATITYNSSNGTVSGTWEFIGTYTDTDFSISNSVDFTGTITTYTKAGTNDWLLHFGSSDPAVENDAYNGELNLWNSDGKYHLTADIFFDETLDDGFGPFQDTFTIEPSLIPYVPPPIISISQYPGYVTEGSAPNSFNITLVRSGAGVGSTSSTVDVTLQDGTAYEGINNDYISYAQTVTFLPTETIKVITLFAVVDDALVENNENFHITLANATNATIGFGTGDVVILDNDGGPIVRNGGSGADTFSGGTGSDTLDGADGGDVISGLGGDDTLTGDAGADKLLGGDGNDTLDGGAGIDSLTGGNGDDTYIIDLAVASGIAKLEDVVLETLTGGTDTIILRGTPVLSVASTILLPTYVENLDASQTGSTKLNITGNIYDNVITGNDADNILNGGAGNDILFGGLGNDTLDGGTGDDLMEGGPGNDTYIVDSLNDTVIEDVGDSGDTVIIAYSNADLVNAVTVDIASFGNIENLKVTGTGLFNLLGDSGHNLLIGNASVNTITGNGGNDTFDGGAGADTMIGGAGNDTYTVDNVGDVIQDSGGNDAVTVNMTTGTYVLAAGIENLTLGGVAAINGTGNTDANIITGNLAANILNDGGAGSDDTLIGGLGNDTYVVHNSGDVITENALGGTDLVQSAVTFTLAANVENLTLLTGAGDIGGFGNTSANIITGNDGNNTLDGKDGIDKLIGGTGNDTYVVDITNVSGVAKLQDSVSEASTGGTDTLVLRDTSDLGLLKATTFILASTLENIDISQTGETHLHITGNAFNNTLTGNDWDNTLNGGLGADVMIGGNGNDTYILDSVSDTVTENGTVDSDSDTVVIAKANALATAVDLQVSDYANIENLTVTGSGLYNLHGDAGDNILAGNSSINTVYGGDGDDTYIAGAGDVFIENASQGTDTVMSGISWSLHPSDNIENITLTGTSSVSATGNELDNVLTGNAGANTLTGNDGNDLLQGGVGADILLGGVGNDTLAGGVGADKLTGGAGADVFVYHAGEAATASNADTIYDFNTGEGDKLNIHDLLTGYSSGTLADWVHLTPSGLNTIVSVDANGPSVGGSVFVNIATLVGVSTASLVDADTMASGGSLAV